MDNRRHLHPPVGPWIGHVLHARATGCNKPTDEDSKTQSDKPGTAATRREKAMTATREPAQSVQDNAYAQKGEFIDAANRELSDVRAEMERLRVEVEHSTGAARGDAEAKLKVVNDKWAAAKAQLDRAEAATRTGKRWII